MYKPFTVSNTAINHACELSTSVVLLTLLQLPVHFVECNLHIAIAPGSPRNLQSVIEDAQCNSELRNVTITWEVSVLSFQ